MRKILKQEQMDDTMIHEVACERIYKEQWDIIGQSAGAMIFNKEYLDTTTGDLLIRDNGFDYYNKIIFPHYNNLPSELLDKIPDNIFKINDNDNLIN